MSLRPKTKRRLLVLLAGAVLITGSVTVVVKVQLRRHEATRLQYRGKAMDAYARGDYAGALEGFKRYLSNESTDAEAIYAYGVSRSLVPRADFAHLSEAKSIFGRYLELRPGETRAQHQLLDIYQKLNYDAEALSLADALLAKEANDVPALKARSKALARQGKNEDALAASMRVNERAPESLHDQKRTYMLMKQLKRPDVEIIARAESMLKAHSSDPKFELLRAFAASLAGDNEGARKWVATAATRNPPDADFVRELAGVLDRLEMFEQSRLLLEKAALDPNASPLLTAALAQRLVENGQYADAIERLKNVDPADSRADARLLGLRALAAYSLDEKSNAATQPATAPSPRAQADAIVNALAQRAGDGIAAAWSSVLKARFARPALNARDAAKLYQTALQRDPDNATGRYFLGLSYRELGETELALQNWRQASQLSPAWIDPHIMTARALLGEGRIDDAFREARIAAARAPGSLPAQTTYAVIAYNQLDSKTPSGQVERLMTRVAEIQARVPNEPQTLPVYVALLARTGHRDDAAAAIRAALGTRPPLSSETLLKLAQASALLELGLERAIAEHLAASPAATPDAAYDTAAVLATAGKPLDGLKSLTAARDASAGANPPAWQLAVARYREAIGDSEAPGAWAQLAAANPQDVEIQRSVLKARSAWSNRALIDRCIENLKALTPADSLDWRMARARWKLEDPDNTRDNANTAAAMMADVARAAPNLADPLVIWAAALEKRGDLPAATDRLRTAVTLSRGNLDVSMSLVRLLQRQGRASDARQVLEQIAQSPLVSPLGRVQVARMLCAQGDHELAAKVLKPAGAGGGSTGSSISPERDLLLAQIAQARGKFDDAAVLYDALLNSPSVDENIVRAAAGFHARRGEIAKARQALARLDGMKLSAGTRELTLATFEEDFGNSSAALAQYEAATRAAPAIAATWKGLAGFHLRRGDYTTAATIAEQGATKVKDTTELSALAAGARTFATFKIGAELQQLVGAFSINPTDAGPAQTLAALAKSQADGETTEQSLARLRGVAEQNPRFLPAQLLLAQRLAAAGRLKDADEVASRAMTALPNEPEGARLLCIIAAAAGQWDRALTAANEWRNRTLDQPLQADLQIADAKLHLNDPAAALRQLTPYLEQAKAAPATMPAVLRLSARALAQDGRTSEAQALLEPLIKDSPAWRNASLDIAASVTRDINTGKTWIERVAPLVGDSKDEQLRLVAAWATLGQRFRDSASLLKARELLQPLANDAANPSVAVLLSFGSLAQELNDLPTAEAAYRKALLLDPRQPSAKNNLAYAILLRKGDLKEAATLAQEAVTAAPGNSSFQDTLARVHARSGNLEAALTGFQSALRADAGNVEALIGLADTQARAGQRDRATTTLEQIDAMLRTNPPLPEPVRKELDDLRVTLKRTPETTSVTDVK